MSLRDQQRAGVGARAQRREESRIVAPVGGAVERIAVKAEAEAPVGGLEKGVFHASSLRRRHRARRWPSGAKPD